MDWSTRMEDAILKLRRGEEQFKTLLSKLETINVKNPIKLDFKQTESPSDTLEYALYVSYVPVIEKEVGILLGETVQSFRISLDYLAWTLVRKSGITLTEKQERYVAFPMGKDKADFATQVKKNNLSHLLSGQLTIIEKYQPYQNTTAGISIGYLQKLSNTDKHRIIVPVGIVPREFEAKLKPEGANILEIQKCYFDGQELSNDTTVLTIVMDGEPQKWNALMEFKASFAISNSIIEPPPSFALAPLDQVFEGIRQTCFEVISEFRYIS